MHYLVDVIDPSQDYSVAQYLAAAERAAAEIRARGRTPLFVGGTPLFRLYETGDAAAAQGRLARSKIWSRIFAGSATRPPGRSPSRS